MPRHLVRIAVLLLFCTCSADDSAFFVRVIFPDNGREQTELLWVVVMKPGGPARCQALRDGVARPGDEGYTVEDKIEIDPDEPGSSRPLDVFETGLRFFFAEASDIGGTVILRGCTVAVAGGGVLQEVTVALDWVSEPCQTNDDCDDGLYCTGEETCVTGMCENGTDPCPGKICAEDTDSCEDCTTDADCDDGLFCTGEETCNAGTCEIGSDPCPGETCDEGTDSCAVCLEGADCDDGLYCTVGETCQSGTCTGGVGRDCSGLDDQCRQGVCSESADLCEVQPVDIGGACDDGGDCTSNDQCDVLGKCLGTFDDAYCDAIVSGDICRPLCSSDATGCLTPPIQIDLVCEDPVVLPALSGCTITLSGGDSVGQQECLACYAEVGMTLVDRTDFSDAAGDCSLDGWTLMSGKACLDKVDACLPDGREKDCCDDFATICDTSVFGAPVLKTDKLTNCGGNVREIRIFKTYDLSGLTDLTLCLGVAGQDATANEGILVYAEDATHESEQIFCNNSGPQAGVDGVLYTFCVDLPVWAEDNPAVTLTVIMHSHDDGDIIFIDDIAVRGWGGGCSPTFSTVLDENFDDPAACDTSGWTLVGSNSCPDFACEGHAEWTPGIHTDASLVMDTTVDASDLDDEVKLCFRIGVDLLGQGDDARFFYDVGSGFQEAWHEGFPDAIDAAKCKEICVNLSDLDPAVNNNPVLGLRFELNAVSGIALYGVNLTGAQNCQVDSSVLALSSPPVGNGLGDYDFTADTHGSRLTGKITCHWEPDPDLSAQDSVSFRP